MLSQAPVSSSHCHSRVRCHSRGRDNDLASQPRERGRRGWCGCTLGKNVFIDEGVVIGDRVKIQNNVSVYRGVELADEVFVGPSAVFTNDMRPRAASRDWRLRSTRVHRAHR